MKRSSLRKYVTIKYFTSKLMVKLCKMKAHFHVQVILICQFKLLQIISSLLKFLSFKYVQFCYGKQTDCSTTFQTKMTVKNKNKDTKTKIQTCCNTRYLKQNLSRKICTCFNGLKDPTPYSRGQYFSEFGTFGVRNSFWKLRDFPEKF